MNISKLSQINAVKISNWHYTDEYSFYNTDADLEDYNEILSVDLRADKFFQVLTANNELLGYFVVEPTDVRDVYEVGLGMAPEFTGIGKGSSFVHVIIEFISRVYKPIKLLLNVAEFNVRAQKVYQRMGFTIFKKEIQIDDHGVSYPFLWMERVIK